MRKIEVDELCFIITKKFNNFENFENVSNKYGIKGDKFKDDFLNYIWIKDYTDVYDYNEEYNEDDYLNSLLDVRDGLNDFLELKLTDDELDEVLTELVYVFKKTKSYNKMF